MIEKDTYKTISKPSNEVLYKEKGSKFLGYAFPLTHELEVKVFIQQLKEAHFKARHWCFAWRIGESESEYKFRVNDDGEPNNSAGQPIYGQILSKDLTNVLVVVVRYFGGTKLGVGGLINAYKTTADLVLSTSRIVLKTIDVHYLLVFDYPDMDKVMRIVKEYDLNIEKQSMELNCKIQIAVRKKEAIKVANAFKNLRCLKIVEV